MGQGEEAQKHIGYCVRIALGVVWVLGLPSLVAAQAPAPGIGMNKFDLVQQYLGMGTSDCEGGGPCVPVVKAMAKKAIADAAAQGIPFFRIMASGYGPTDLRLWRSSDTNEVNQFWNAQTEMMNDLRTAGVKVVPVFAWHHEQFPELARDMTETEVAQLGCFRRSFGNTFGDHFTNPNACSYRLLERYISDWINRFHNFTYDSTIYFYELTNELTLSVDLDLVRRCVPNNPDNGNCTRTTNFTTDDMVSFTNRLASFIRAHDSSHLISSGFSLPRANQQHRRSCPEWISGSSITSFSFDHEEIEPFTLKSGSGESVEDLGWGARTEPSPRGRALSLDAGAWVEVDSTSASAFGWTLGAWFRSPHSQGDILTFPGREGSSQGGYRLSLDRGQLCLRPNTAMDTESRCTKSRVDDDLWHHAALTVSNTEVRLYLDGRAEIATPLEGELAGETLAGLRMGGKRGGFIGALDEVHLLDRPLPEHEVNSLKAALNCSQAGQPDAQWETQQYMQDSHDGIDILSVHLYNGAAGASFDQIRWDIWPGFDPKNNADIVTRLKQISTQLGKPLFLGEVGDLGPDINDSGQGQFMRNVIDRAVESGVPYTALWTWEDYSSKIWEMHHFGWRDGCTPQCSAECRDFSFNLEPGFHEDFLAYLRGKNQQLGNPAPFVSPQPPRVIITEPLHGTQMRETCPNQETVETCPPQLEQRGFCPEARPHMQFVQVVASDESGPVSRVEFYVDNVLKHTAQGQLELPYSSRHRFRYELDLRTLAPGTHTVIARAYDASGQSADASVTVNGGTGGGGGGSNYVGCFTDDGNRALPFHVGYNYSVETCRQEGINRGYVYAGLQYYGQCFLGNTLGYTQVAESECNTPCNANPSQICGGPWRNSIYRTGLAPPATTTLSVSKSGSGAGSVDCSTVNIHCGGTCSASVPIGTAATLVATPASGSTFAGWSGGGCSGSGNCTVTVSQATTVTATFNAAPVYQTLAVGKNGSGTGLVYSSPGGIYCGTTCASNYPQGSWVTLYAAPDSGSTFAGWSGGGCWGTGACTVPLNQYTYVVATFNAAPVYQTLAVGKNGSGTGLVYSNPGGIYCGTTCASNYPQGSWVTLYAAPDSGSTFAGWSGGGCWGTGACTVPLNQYTYVVATFNASGPVITAITDSSYQSTIYPWSTIIVWGSGFSPWGGNSVQLMRAGYADVWLYQGDGHYFWDYSSNQINASLDWRAASGWWTAVVRNANAWPSAPFWVYIGY